MCFGIGVKIPSKAYFLFFGSSFISENARMVCACLCFSILQGCGGSASFVSDLRRYKKQRGGLRIYRKYEKSKI